MSAATKVVSTAPDDTPKMLVAKATVSSKQLLALINAAGDATQCAWPIQRLEK